MTLVASSTKRSLASAPVRVLSLLMLLSVVCGSQSVGADNQTDPADEIFGSEAHPATSIEAYTNTDQTALGLMEAAQYATRERHFDQAIEFCKQALAKDSNDIDVHKEYAESLEAKINHVADCPDDLFNECIKQWLIVLRNEVGEERGMSIHGINPLGHLYEDEDRGIPAKMHLKALTGQAPRPWQTDAQYLKQVSRAQTSVSGRIVGGSKKEADSKPADNAPKGATIFMAP
jgi:hypothetical protein